jgi:arginyl-tRNA synthetase
LAYEHVVLPQGRFSGRQGTWMAGHATEGSEGADTPTSRLGFTADELLLEAQSRAVQKVRADYTHEQKNSIARAVAVGAIRFAFLRVSAGQKITFDYDQALSLTGDSGPYVMYAYARACAIRRKAEAAGVKAKPPPSDYTYNEQEVALLRLMLRGPETVASSAEKYEVHPIAEYALEIAGKFNQMYTTTPVLEEGTGARQGARLAEVEAARAILGQVMDLLGLPKLEMM